MTQSFNFSNLPQIIPYIYQNHQNPKAFNFIEDGKWVNISTTEFVNRVKNLTLALKAIGLNKGDKASIISCPNPIWLMMDFAILSAGAISVPLFPNIAAKNLAFETQDADVKFIFCDSKEMLQMIQNSGRKFEKIIIYGFKIEDKDDNIIEFSDLLNQGRTAYINDPSGYQKLIDNLNEDDLAMIIYTSGSTDRPKGVELTHKNIISQIKSIKELFPLSTNQDVALSFLPLSHIFERTVSSYYIACSISIYFVDDVKNLATLIKEVKPTMITLVPRVLEKIYSKIKDNIACSSLITRIIASLALKLAIKLNPDDAHKSLWQSLIRAVFDLLVYRKIRKNLGTQFKFMVCGSAPLALELEKFFKNIGINLFIGYGLTESSLAISANYPGHNKIGTVGQPFLGIDVKLNKDGELLAKGANIMRGYHNSPKKTAETINKEGWLQTGDLAKIDEQGYITIIGRKKELFKTSTGKYVSPVKIEQKLLSNCNILSAACIIAEGRKFTSCLLFADFEILEKYKKQVNMTNLSNQEFLKSDLIKQRLKQTIEQINSNLNHWEQIKKYHLIDKEISIQGGELTPSMKLCRNVIEKKYSKIINEFYYLFESK